MNSTNLVPFDSMSSNLTTSGNIVFSDLQIKLLQTFINLLNARKLILESFNSEDDSTSGENLYNELFKITEDSMKLVLFKDYQMLEHYFNLPQSERLMKNIDLKYTYEKAMSGGLTEDIIELEHTDLVVIEEVQCCYKTKKDLCAIRFERMEILNFLKQFLKDVEDEKDDDLEIEDYVEIKERILEKVFLLLKFLHVLSTFILYFVLHKKNPEKYGPVLKKARATYRQISAKYRQFRFSSIL